MKQKGFVEIIALVIILLVAVGAGAYYFGRQTENKTVTSSSGVPTSSSTPTEISKSSPFPAGLPSNETAGWKTYSNTAFDLSFKYPKEFTLEENISDNGGRIQLIMNKGKDDVFILGATLHPEGDVNYFLDTKSDGTRRIGVHTWTTFLLPKGYSDGGEISTKPIYGLKLEYNDVMYSWTFYKSSLSPLDEQIVSTLEFVQ